MIEQNRVKQAYVALMEREKSISEDLVSDSALVSWNKEKRRQLQKILVVYSKTASQQERDSLLILKSKYKELNKILSNRPNRWLRAFVGVIRRPFIISTFEKLENENRYKVASQLSHIGLSLDEKRAAQYINFGGKETQVEFNKWLGSEHKMQLDFDVKMEDDGRKNVVGVHAKLFEKNDTQPKANVYIDFNETGRLLLTQIQSLLLGNPVQITSDFTPKGTAQWFQITYEHGEGTLKSMNADHRVKEELLDLPLARDMNIKGIMARVNAGKEVDVYLTNGTCVSVSADPFREKALKVTDASGIVVDVSTLKAAAKAAQVVSMYQNKEISEPLKNEKQSGRNQDNNLSIS